MKQADSVLLSILFLVLIEFGVGFQNSAFSAELTRSMTSIGPDSSQATVTPSQGLKADQGLNKKFKRSRLTYDQSEATADRRRLLLTTGEDKAIDLDFDANMTPNGISYGNPQVVTATLAKIGNRKQVILKPLKSGETTVTIRDMEGNIGVIFVVRVTGSNLDRIRSEISDLLRDIEGLNIRVVGPKIVVEGEVLVPADYGRLYTVISDKSYADFVLNLTTLSPLAMQFLANRIQVDISGFAPNVKTRVVNGMIFLEGSTDNIAQAQRAAQIAALYVPEIKPSSLLDKDVTAQRMAQRSLIQNFIMVNPAPPRKLEKLVRVSFHFVELRKDYNKVFGFKWQPGFTTDPSIALGQNAAGATSASSGGASFSGTLSSLLPQLNSMQQAGYGRVLKTGTVIVRSGQPAKLNEQTQYPFTVMGANGTASSQSKDVGLAVAVTPLILGQSEDIQMDLEIDQTDVVGRPPAAGSPPVTAVHKVSTKVYIKSNESAAIAGVTAHDVGTDFNKDDPMPGSFSSGSGGSATTIPVFSLLRSKNYRKNKSNFVIFVTPQIIENASDGTDDLKRNFRVKVN